jgi:hypothetical protein
LRGAAAIMAEKISDADATSAFVALRYWARATRYQPTEAERDVLTACEERSNFFWRAGLAAGAGAGLALTTVSKLQFIQGAAVAGSFASVGSLMGQYKANAPCLHDIFEVGRHTHSPLERQARRIVSEGGKYAVQRILQEQAATDANAAGPALPAPAARPARGSVESSDAPEERTLAPRSSAEESDFHSPQHSPDAGAREQAGPPSDSWEAVRQRYQARLAGDEPSTSSGLRLPAPPKLDNEPSPRRVRRNAYGDEIVEDRQ